VDPAMDTAVEPEEEEEEAESRVSRRSRSPRHEEPILSSQGERGRFGLRYT
jgi:hypothetical protein